MSRSPSLDQVLASLPPTVLPLLEALASQTRRARGALYLVGGPVRDVLLGRPIGDVDLLVVPGRKAGSIARSAAPPEAKVTEYGRFGTLRIELPDGAVDVAGARSETYARAGALPTVVPGSLEEDLLRRDFSVNTLAMALHEPARTGPLPVIDLCGGLPDLRGRQLRALHPGSFHDDPTRILRAGRLLPRLGFKLARPTGSALRAALKDGVVGQVGGERLRREFEKLFADARLGLDPALALRQLASWGFLSALESGLEWPKSAAAPVRRLGKVLAEPGWKPNRYRPWVPGLALWLAPQRPGLRKKVLARLAVRGETAERIAGFARQRDRLLGRLKRARGRGAVDALLSGIHEEILQALYVSAEPAVRQRILRWAAEDRTRRAPATGDDLTGLGVEGPAVGKLLAKIRVAHLDGAIANREEAMALAVEWTQRQARARRRERK